MADLMLATRYWDDLTARAAFKSFLLEIHGLDLSDWETAGYWDDAYTPFSYFQDDLVIASACIYLLDAVVDGTSTHVAQISGVGTLPAWRRQGLNRKLTEIGLDWARGRHDGVFLFADAGAIPFYDRCGFQAIDEYLETVAVAPVARRAGAVKLDPAQKKDLDRIYALARRRAPVSDRFGVVSAKLFMFHVLHTLSDCVYEIPALGCLVCHERANGCLKLFDVVGERVPRLAELYPYIADPTDKIIEFHFFPDKLDVQGATIRQLSGNHPFVRGAFPVAKPVFPFTCRA